MRDSACMMRIRRVRAGTAMRAVTGVTGVGVKEVGVRGVGVMVEVGTTVVGIITAAAVVVVVVVEVVMMALAVGTARIGRA